ncbi:MAG: type II secretion system protein GspN [Bdellovibrionales bacterium]
MIGKAIQFFIDIFRLHKLKIVCVILSALLFALVLFPYDDLSEVVSTVVSERTNNQIFLQFDRLGFQIFPLPALAVENVVVESSFMPSLQAGHLSLAPSITGFLSFRPGFNAGISDVWNGDIDVELKAGKKNEQGITQQLVRLEVDKIDLAKANESLDLPLKLQGKLSGDSNLTLDPSFANQPEGDIEIQVKELRFPSGTIPTQMGPVMLPGMNWSNIQLKGRMNGGKLQIEQAQLGSASDLLNGTVKGEIDMRLEPRGAGQAGVSWGPYQLTVDLNVNSKLDKDLGLFLGLLGNFKSATSTGSKYKFKVSGQRFGAPPSLSPANI